MKRYIILLTILLTGLFILSSCKTTEVVSSWSLPNPPANVMNKVLVLGVMVNRELRDKTENEMVNELNRNGIMAISATSVFGPKGFQGLNDQQITERLNGSDFTSVMIVALMDREKEQIYTPGTRYATPRVAGYSRYYRRYIVVYDQQYTPGYYTTSTNYILQADIYSIEDDALIYSAQTNSYDPNSNESLARSFAQSIVGELRTKGIIHSH